MEQLTFEYFMKGKTKAYKMTCSHKEECKGDKNKCPCKEYKYKEVKDDKKRY